MHDEEWPACSLGARSAYRRREVRAVAQTVTCRQHAGSSGGELGAALATTGSDDGAAGARAHAQAETVRLGAAAVVRLEGALAHEVLRCLRAGRRGTSRSRVQSSGSTAGCNCAATAIGKPMDRRHRGRSDLETMSRAAPRWRRATGMRKRSRTRSVNDTGAREGGSNRCGPLAPSGKSPIVDSSRRNATRHAEGHGFLRRSGCQPDPELLGFRVSRCSLRCPLRHDAQGVDNRVDNVGTQGRRDDRVSATGQQSSASGMEWHRDTAVRDGWSSGGRRR